MALLLAAAGAFLYARLGAELLHTTDSALRTQAAAVAAGIGQSGVAFGDQASTGVATFAQLVDASGRIVESSAGVAGVSVVSGAQLASVKGPTFLEHTVPSVAGVARILVVPSNEPGAHLFVVVGSSLHG